MVLEEFDEEKIAKINPTDYEKVVPNFPKIGITCFSNDLINKYAEIFNGKIISTLKTANGIIPIYEIIYQKEPYVLFMSRVGAAACVVSYEEVLAKGLEKLIMFGTCGVLDSKIKDLAIVIPNSAIRDEGTSYHYVSASNEVLVNEHYQDEFIKILEEHNISWVNGKVWTTDAPYRETANKILKRKKQGCICVDMECSAMSAVANFRNKELFQFFYAADNLDNVIWEERSLDNESRLEEKEKIIYLALELAKKMNK